MTEDEAKDKWCSMVRVNEVVVGEGVTTSRNRVSQVVGDDMSVLSDRLLGANCIASGCMMWRIHRAVVENPETGMFEPLGDKTDGYCGLAGKP